MPTSRSAVGIRRCSLLQGGSLGRRLQVASPSVFRARAADVVKIGLDNPLTGALGGLGKNELIGCQLASNRSMRRARTRIETLFTLGRKPELPPEKSLMDGINAGRKTIPFARCDAKRCAQDLESLVGEDCGRDRSHNRCSGRLCRRLFRLPL
jgi:hypothetical protein